jgi:nitrate reductase NapE component
MLPGVALRLAAFDPEPLPGGTDHADQAGHADLLDVARRPIDPTEVRDRTARTVRLLTGFVHGLAWPAVAAGVVLAFAGQPAGPALATVVGAALLLRGRLFPRRGERLPLVLAGLGTLLAVPAGLLASAASPAVLVGVAVAAGLAAAISAVIALGRVGRSPARARAAEIIDLVLTIATIPLVAAVLGAFGYVRGLGG